MLKLIGLILVVVALIIFLNYKPAQVSQPYGFCNSDADCSWKCGFCKSNINDTSFCGGLIPPGMTYGNCICQNNQCAGGYVSLSGGELIVAVKDDAKKLSRIGTVYNLYLTVNSVEAHFVGEDENATGEWIVLFSGNKTFDLLQFTNVSAIIGDQQLAAGKYTQIRLNLSDSSIKIYNLDLSIFNKTYPLKVSSKELKLVHNFDIEQNKTTVLTLDFDVEQSVKKEGLNYVLRPTVKILEESLPKGQKPTNSTEV
jgi:hypothetical protein